MLTPARPSPSEPSRASFPMESGLWTHARPLGGHGPRRAAQQRRNRRLAGVASSDHRRRARRDLDRAATRASRLGSRLADSHHRAGVHRRHRGAHGRHRATPARHAHRADRALPRRRRRNLHDDVARHRAGVLSALVAPQSARAAVRAAVLRPHAGDDHAHRIDRRLRPASPRRVGARDGRSAGPSRAGWSASSFSSR